MPFLLDGQFKVFLSAVLRNWCVGAAWMLGLRSYLLGDVIFEPSVSCHSPPRIHCDFNHPCSHCCYFYS